MISELSNRLFRRPQEDDTIVSYARAYTRMLAVVIRSHLEPYDKYPVPLTRAHADAVDALVNAIRGREDLSRPIHDLCYCLLTSVHEHSQLDEFFCPVRRATVILCINDRGVFIAPRLISPKFSMLQYCWRATFAKQCEIMEADEPHQTYFRYVCFSITPRSKSLINSR